MEYVCDDTFKVVLFATAPKLEDLCCIIVHINPLEKHDISAKSSYHWQILKCRQLIFTELDIIASPVFRNNNRIHVIMSRQYYNSGSIQQKLEKLKMEIQQTVTLSNAIYEACLRYTILALMAPIWNQAGEYMVQGRNFLHSQSPMNAVKMEIGMKHDEMFIAVWPLRVRMRPLEFSDLDIVPSTKEEFFSKHEGYISEPSLGAQQLHVLPSLKKGRIVSISRRIPSSCPYQSYKELKRHWKNLYGYRLPESDETILYFTMHFNAFSSTVYTYPSLCVRPDGLQFHSRVNFKEVLGSFIQDLTKKVPKICGHEFAVTKKLVCAVPKMLSWDQSSEIPSFHGSPKLNLKKVTRFDGNILESTIFSDFEYPFDSEINTLTQKTSLCKDVSACSQKLSLMTPTCNTSEQACTPKQEFLGRHFTDNTHKTHHSLGDSPPLFLPYAIPPRSQQTTSMSKGDKTCKMCPSLGDSPPLFLPYSISLKTQLTASTSNGNEMKPLFNSSSTSVGNYSGMSTIQQEIKPIVPVFSKHFKFDVTSDKATSSKSPMSQDESLKTSSKVNMVKLSTIVKEFQLKREIEPVTKFDECPFPKKPRSRPRVQPDMDVEALARVNDLGKVNTATLVKWLRENKVSCKVKDKKSDLVNKVMAYLNISSNLVYQSLKKRVPV